MAASKKKGKLAKEWSFSDITQLIELWEQNPCLYNITLKEYRDRDKKKAAVKSLAEAFEETTEDDVTAKLSTLRVQYNRALNKMAATPKSGSSTNDARKARNVTWPHFESLHFLKDFCTPKPTRSNIPGEIAAESQSQNEEEREEYAEPPNYDDNGMELLDSSGENSTPSNTDLEKAVTAMKSTKRPTGKKRSRHQNKEEDEEDKAIMMEAVSVLKKASTASPFKEPCADDLFGQIVATELKGIKDEQMKRVVKHRINTILFESQIEPARETLFENSAARPPFIPSGQFYTLPPMSRQETMQMFSAPRLTSDPVSRQFRVASPNVSATALQGNHDLVHPTTPPASGQFQAPSPQGTYESSRPASAISSGPSSPISDYSVASNFSGNNYTILN